MKRSLLDVIIDQCSTVPPVIHTDLTGKTVVIVGANVGIGFEAAKHFARMNPAKLILGCRDENRGRAALAEIQRTTGSENCEVWKVDLADFTSVKTFAERFEKHHDRLDILIMNAAILIRRYESTVNGWESALQVNHLATSLMALLLLPRMVDTGKKFGTNSRLVIVSSDVHYWADFPEDVKLSPCPIAKLNSEEHRDWNTHRLCDPRAMRDRYMDTKLMNVFFARALQDRIPPNSPLTINAVNPGFCLSNLRRNESSHVLITTAYFILEKTLAWTAEEGSRQLVYAAIGEQDDEERMKGAFVNRCEVVEPSEFVVSEEGKRVQESLWRETIQILTEEAPRLKSIVEEYLR